VNGEWHPDDHTIGYATKFMPGFERMVALARETLGRVEPPGYVAWSGGKDSTVTAAFAVEKWPDIPVVLMESTEFPETLDYVRGVAAERNWNLHVIPGVDRIELLRESGALEVPARADITEVLDGSIVGRTAPQAHALFGPLVIWGLRAQEARHRAMALCSRDRRGVLTRKDGTTTCAPLWAWTHDHIWAAHAMFGIAPNPIYKRLAEVGCPRDHRRVGPLIGHRGAGHGRFTFLAAGWPELWADLCEQLPGLRALA